MSDAVNNGGNEARVRASLPPMATCGACGSENPDGARFCNGCAAPLKAADEGHRQRKTVTLVFCDVVGSTALGESTDPEALEVLLAHYFERMKAIVETHGGTVEKFIGDAVVAVFGVPVGTRTTRCGRSARPRRCGRRCRSSAWRRGSG
jgi:class 3 adenylate cyclase